MSDSGEVISNLVDNNSDSNSSNEVLCTIEKKGKASTQEPSTMFGKELGDCEFDSAPGPMVNTEVKNGKTEMAPDDTWIGVVVTKVYNGVRYVGQVTSYNAETGWFKIIYEDNSWEEVAEDEIPQILASFDIIRSYYNREATGGSSRKSHQRKRKPAQENKVATPPEQKNPAKKARKPKKASTYVPLAVRENKKDAYYWYW